MRLTVAKFGGSAIGSDGEYIPKIVSRIRQIGSGSKVLAVFSAPLTTVGGKKMSLTDVVIGIGENRDTRAGMGHVRNAYEAILRSVGPGLREQCRQTIDSHLARAREALESGEFADERRSVALGFSGEVLMGGVMDHVLRSEGLCSAAVPFEDWPVVTDDNIEYTNFLADASGEKIGAVEDLLRGHDIVCMGGFVGRTKTGTVTTYERGGTDRTAADMGILLRNSYETSIDFEKDRSVASADPKIVSDGLSKVPVLSYNEARLAGMFGMKILDPVAIKEILENGADMPITITDMKDPSEKTTIERSPVDAGGDPVKIVTGRENCAIMRAERAAARRLLDSLEAERRYSEYVVLSPFTRDGIDLSRILFLDGDYAKRNEKYLLGFDPLASITYGRGVITLIGDQMWKARHIVSMTSARMAEVGLNILNMDAQEETSRIIVVVEDSGDNVQRAVRAVHSGIKDTSPTGG